MRETSLQPRRKAQTKEEDQNTENDVDAGPLSNATMKTVRRRRPVSAPLSRVAPPLSLVSPPTRRDSKTRFFGSQQLRSDTGNGDFGKSEGYTLPGNKTQRFDVSSTRGTSAGGRSIAGEERGRGAGRNEGWHPREDKERWKRYISGGGGGGVGGGEFQCLQARLAEVRCAREK